MSLPLAASQTQVHGAPGSAKPQAARFRWQRIVYVSTIRTMPAPIVIAYHLIWTAYGWWLPNDPRGSMSRAIASDLLAELGVLHFGRKRIQPARSDLLH